MSEGLGFIKIRREIQQHWLSKKLEWRACWEDILLTAKWDQDGFVCLTDVPARRLMSKSAWRHFIKLLQEDNMLSNVESRKLGKGKGSIQVAYVTNWNKYQGEGKKQMSEDSNSQRHSKHSLNDTLNDTHSNTLKPDEEGQNNSSGISKRHSKRHSKHSLNVPVIKELKELKEVKEKESSSYAIIFSFFSSENFLETLYQENPKRRNLWPKLSPDELTKLKEQAETKQGKFVTNLRALLDKASGVDDFTPTTEPQRPGEKMIEIRDPKTGTTYKKPESEVTSNELLYLVGARL